MEQLCCTKAGHGNKPIQGICKAPMCQSDQRIFCLSCLQTLHSQCFNDFYDKDTLVNSLVELQYKTQQTEPEIIQVLKELAYKSKQFLTEFTSLAAKILQEYERINPINRIEEILLRSNTLSCFDWNEGYRLLTETPEIIPQSTKGLIEQLNQIKQCIDQLTQLQSQEQINPKTRQMTQSNITTSKAFTINTSHQISSIALSPNGSQIASSGMFGDYQIQIWDIITGNPLGSLKGHLSNIGSINYSKCGQYLVSCSGDKTIRQWDVQRYKQYGETMTGHSDAVMAVQYSADQRYIVSCSLDQSVRVWDSKTGKELDKRIKHSQLILCLSLSSIKNEVAFGNDNIQIWNYEKHQQIGKALECHSKCISIKYSPNGKLLLSGCKEQKIQLWDAETRVLIISFFGHNSEVYSVNFSPNQKYIVSGGQDQLVRIWDRSTEEQIGQIQQHQAGVHSTQFSLCGKYIISGAWDKQIKIVIAPIDQ